MPSVRVIILHCEPTPDAGPLERMLAAARAEVAAHQAAGFRRTGAKEVEIIGGPPDDLRFGDRLTALLRDRPSRASRGVVVLGAGSIPLARARDLRAFVVAASSAERGALANNRYSADVVAIARADRLPPVPPLPGDNALPRWLEEVAGWTVRDLRRRWRLGVDLDSPLDLLLAERAGLRVGRRHDSLARSSERIDAVSDVLADRRAQVVVAGRTSARSVRWLERRTAARIRALVEERGLRASTTLALATPEASERTDATHARRPPRSTLGLLLDRDGPAALGAILAELGDAAVVDSRVLLAHRLGPDEARWPCPEDRFASDLLEPGAISDPWLRELTTSALEAPIPVLLGGHTLVGPGIRLVARAAGHGDIPARESGAGTATALVAASDR